MTSNLDNQEFKYDVFLSYSSKDKPAVVKLAKYLHKNGLRIWFDDWIVQTGDDIILEIEKGLEKSRILVLVMTDNAFGSDWVSLERNTSLFRDPTNHQRRFIPLLLTECEIPAVLRRYKYIDFRKEGENKYKQLLKDCQAEIDTLVDENLANQQNADTVTSQAIINGSQDPDLDYLGKLQYKSGRLPSILEFSGLVAIVTINNHDFVLVRHKAPAI
ncbi:MAG: toll/interleukin-1 receptor domain-containing protein [Chloroflexi bacterium]|nr:toll/interleukin-1 receptor domain-containing protein [Chloroflexota bacterium]